MFRTKWSKFNSQDDKDNDLSVRILAAFMLAVLALAVLATLAQQAG